MNKAKQKIEEILEKYQNSYQEIILNAGTAGNSTKDKLVKELTAREADIRREEYERGVAHGKLQEALLQKTPTPKTYYSDTANGYWKENKDE